jgi:hypothetical protein
MKLIFVYNAKSDKINALVGYAHKIISPSTYNCDLCKLTHSNFGERKEWSDFKKELSSEIRFYHIDEFEKKFNTTFEYPVVLNEELEILLDSKTIAQLKNVSELTRKIDGLLKD